MPLKVLIADDEDPARYALKRVLAPLECELHEAADGHAALALIRDHPPDLILLDLTMPGMGGVELLRELQPAGLAAEVVVITADDTLDSAIECMRLGAADYLAKPYEVERLRAIVRRNQRRVSTERRLGALEQRLGEASCGELRGASPALHRLIERIHRAAPAPLDVLIRGETGTGKELIARELHRLSGRSGPFVAINTAALSETLAESQLFGHVRGAFTGAERAHKGVFEQAAGGTLFLDEIGDMPLPLQAKILRALQERTVQPLGATRPVPVEVRVVSATHQDLDRAIAEGLFREDLYFRLRGLELSVPPLRERPEDILPLAEHCLEQLAGRGGPQRRLGEGVAARLLAHHWPGNVRELQQVVQAAAVMAAGAWIEPADLALGSTDRPVGTADLPALEGLTLAAARARLVEWYEQRAVRGALERNDGNISAAARELGLHRQSLQQKLTQLGIPRPRGPGR
ncbi:MAG: sigma-54 dependent transcriptional regulator [Candidatus Competibacterales bacterium]|nr:sigma-54 dependent transcriptional regulator [Candidatus Competibacterales bacterium]